MLQKILNVIPIRQSFLRRHGFLCSYNWLWPEKCWMLHFKPQPVFYWYRHCHFYLLSAICEPMIDYVFSFIPRRIIFNPGTRIHILKTGQELRELLWKKLALGAIIACSILNFLLKTLFRILSCYNHVSFYHKKNLLQLQKVFQLYRKK